MLDFVRENGAEVQAHLTHCKYLLEKASLNLKIFDPVLGEEELVKSVAVELAKVTALMAENSQRQ